MKVELNKLHQFLATRPRLSGNAKFLFACLEFCKSFGKEKEAYEYLERRLNPGKECIGIDQFVRSTLLLPTKSKLSKKYYAMFKALDLDVKSVKSRRKIKEMQQIIGDRPIASYSDEGIRILLSKEAEEQAQQPQQKAQKPIQSQQPDQQNRPQQGRLF